MFRRLRRLRTSCVRFSTVSARSESCSESLFAELERYWRHEWAAANAAPIDNASAVTDTHKAVDVIQVVTALDHLWKTLWMILETMIFAWMSASEIAENALRNARKITKTPPLGVASRRLSPPPYFKLSSSSSLWICG